MKLLFKVTPELKTYLTDYVQATYNNQVVEVALNYGMELLKNCSRNFFKFSITDEKLGPQIYEPLKLSEITVVTISYHLEVLLEYLMPTLPLEVEFIILDNVNNSHYSSAAKAFNEGIKRSSNDIVICAHEDVRFSKGWFEDFIDQECKLKNWGALGIVGQGLDDRLHWGADEPLPLKTQTLDECCTILNKKNGLYFDEKTFTDWHHYTTDFCLQCQSKGLDVYIVAGPASHGSKTMKHVPEWRQTLVRMAELLKKKWHEQFPVILTTTGRIA